MNYEIYKTINEVNSIFLIHVAIYVHYCTEVLINWLSAYLTAQGTVIRKKRKDLPCVVDIIMSSLRSTLRDLLAVYKTLIVLITPLILIVVPLSWNTTVSRNKSRVIYRSLGKFRSHLDATFVF